MNPADQKTNAKLDENQIFAQLTFSGAPGEDAASFYQDFITYCNMEKLKHDELAFRLRLMLKGPALTWLRSLGDLANSREILAAFQERFLRKNTLFSVVYELCCGVQEEGEPVLEFLDRMKSIAVKINLSDDVLVPIVLRALPDNISEPTILFSKGNSISWAELYDRCKTWDLFFMHKSKGRLGAAVPLMCTLCNQKGHSAKDCGQAEQPKEPAAEDLHEGSSSPAQSAAASQQPPPYNQHPSAGHMNYF
ncbi:hypothetical protein PAPHI01_1716 [Pancytospora philotis]|nr:hypothetical protein PAPHI01_1716 [Pancytospora philotis]